MPYLYLCLGAFFGFTLAALLSANTASHREQRIAELEQENAHLKAKSDYLVTCNTLLKKNVGELEAKLCISCSKRKPKRGGQTMGVVA